MGIMRDVHREQIARTDTELRVRLTADPAGVPGVRRLVAETLRAWGRSGLVDDATLCASELAGNAALHSGCSYIEVAVSQVPDGVRVSVEDDGAVPVSMVAPRTTLPGLDDSFDVELDELDLLLADQPATGRGLAIVSALAYDWGVQELDHGKRVWAHLAESPGASRDKDTQERTTADASAALPAGWVAVTLPHCPTALARRQDQHLDELARELKLMLYGTDDVAGVDLARRLQPVIDASSYVRLSVRRQVDEAVADGLETVDVTLALPSGFSSDLRRLDDALGEADTMSEQEQLLVLPSSPEVRAFRAWMNAQIIGQAERGATPVGWESWQEHRT